MERNSPEEILSWLNAQDEERRKDLVTAIGGKVEDWERLE